MFQTDTHKKTGTLALAAILTALVIILQMMGQFIRFGMFSISLVLIPIVIGAVLCGPKIGAWLGFVFGIVVLATDASAFLVVNTLGTIITVIAKGTLCGYVAGLTYQLLEKRNRILAVIVTTMICPIVNTGIFLIGCRLFFFETITAWGIGLGFKDVTSYIIYGLVGANFLAEMATNILLCPSVIRVLQNYLKNH